MTSLGFVTSATFESSALWSRFLFGKKQILGSSARDVDGFRQNDKLEIGDERPVQNTGALEQILFWGKVTTQACHLDETRPNHARFGADFISRESNTQVKRPRCGRVPSE